jgi:hypothetical protein
MEDESYLALLQSFLWDHGLEVEVAAGAPECRALMREFAPAIMRQGPNRASPIETLTAGLNQRT